MKKRRKLIKHCVTMQWNITLGLPKGKKSYYFKKQIEVAEKLLKNLEIVWKQN